MLYMQPLGYCLLTFFFNYFFSLHIFYFLLSSLLIFSLFANNLSNSSFR